MLVNFRFKNFRSFYNDTNLSMEAVPEKELGKINTFAVENKLLGQGNNELLKSAVIFGSNASGKSNVFKALAYMKNVVIISGSQYPIVQNVEYFQFYKDAQFEDSLFEIELIQNGTFYKYGFIINSGTIQEEWLYRKKERLSPVFKREQSSFKITGLSKQASKLINISPNTLFLSVGKNFHLDIAPALDDVMTWFQNLLIVFENNANSLDIYSVENGKYKDRALKILELADLGIKNIEVVKDKVDNLADLNDVLRFNSNLQINPMEMRQIKREESGLFNIDMVTSFEVFNNENKPVGNKDVLLLKNNGFNSEGTVRLLCYLGWILAALDQGRVIVIDEIDSKLHFLVADYLLKLFNSIDKNAKNAQLICTAHNVMLMDEDLRRDQIYFTSKDSVGVSTLVSLSDYPAVRKGDLFSKKYLAGFYAQLPDMTEPV